MTQSQSIESQKRTVQGKVSRQRRRLDLALRGIIHLNLKEIQMHRRYKVSSRMKCTLGIRRRRQRLMLFNRGSLIRRLRMRLKMMLKHLIWTTSMTFRMTRKSSYLLGSSPKHLVPNQILMKLSQKTRKIRKNFHQTRSDQLIMYSRQRKRVSTRKMKLKKNHSCCQSLNFAQHVTSNNLSDRSTVRCVGGVLLPMTIIALGQETVLERRIGLDFGFSCGYRHFNHSLLWPTVLSHLLRLRTQSLAGV